MPRKVFCACGQALAVPDNYPKPVARCSACGGTVSIPGAAPSPYAQPTTPAYTPPVQTAPLDSPYGKPPGGLGAEPTYGQAPKQISNDARVLWVILGLVGAAAVLFCGCGGILFFALSGSSQQQAERKPPFVPNPPPNIPAPNIPVPNVPTPPAFTPPIVRPQVFWQHHISSGGAGFECDFPAGPRTQTSVVDGAQEYRVSATAGAGEYVVRSYAADDVRGKEGATTPLESLYRRMHKRENLGGDPSPGGGVNDGREIASGMNGRAFRAKFREAGNRVFELSYSGPANQFDQGNWMRFVSSFQFRGDLLNATTPPAVPPPPAITPPIVTPPTPPPAVAQAADEFKRKRIYVPLKFKKLHMQSLQDAQSKANNPRIKESLQKTIDRITEELSQEIDRAAQSNNMTRAQVEELIREGEDKKW